jgi:hypothetical protein
MYVGNNGLANVGLILGPCSCDMEEGACCWYGRSPEFGELSDLTSGALKSVE